jgi:HPr kinase/phosphorylase
MPTIHASAVLVGARAVLIRGQSGAGKSRLVVDLLRAPATPPTPFVRLVADDRAHIWAVHGRLLVSAPEALAGLIEVRGLGIRQVDYEAVAVVGWVLDLAADDAERSPQVEASHTILEGVTLPRIAVSSCADPLPVLLAALGTTMAAGEQNRQLDVRCNITKSR